MSCVVRWWVVLFVKGMHFSSKNACLLNLCRFQPTAYWSIYNVTRWLNNFFIFGHFQQRQFPKKCKRMPNWVLNFAKYKIMHKNSQKSFNTKFCQIWSHCLCVIVYMGFGFNGLQCQWVIVSMGYSVNGLQCPRN